MSKIQFRVAARTDAAGKYNATAPLEGNEDNMFLDADLSNNAQGEFMADKVVDLSDKGCLMVVADGMGGMNAGEVASAIAIKTVMEYFDFEHMKDKAFRDSRSRINYMEDVVVAADAAIKADSRTNKEHEGMGSTIIMAWLCDNEICLTWCGDSRAYLYRPGRGFWQVSKDHSYVQGLVDDGKITMDEAFDHPYSNIITRSLGDPEKKAKADSKVFHVFEGDIFMLCSDGLSGVLRDRKTYDANGQRIETENLEDIIAANHSSMAECRDELFAAAERNDWYDNVTAILCEVVKGKALPADEPIPVKPIEPTGYSESPDSVQPKIFHGSRISIRKKSLPVIIMAAVLLFGVVGLLVWLFIRPNKPSNDKDYFAYCKDHPTIENYRSYVRKYPQGEFVELANNWINEWVADSAAKANLKEAPNSKSQPLETPVEKKRNKEEENKKGDQKVQGQDPNSTVKQPTEEDWNRSDEIGNPANPNQGITPNDPNHGLVPSDSQQGLTPVNPNKGLNSGGGLTQTKSAPPSSEEEAYRRTQRKEATIEDCCDYIDRWSNNGKYVADVRKKFRLLYAKKFEACNSYEDYKTFLDEHDRIMRKIRLNGSPTDTQYRNKAEEKMEELRPKPGAQNAPQNNSNKSDTNKKTISIQRK